MFNLWMIAIAIAFSSSASRAALIGDPLYFPIFNYGVGTSSYDVGTTLYSVDAPPTNLKVLTSAATVVVTPADGSGDHYLRLRAHIDSTGLFTSGVAGDDFAIAGKVILPTYGTFSGLLLEGEVLKFGYADGGTTDTFDLEMRVTGGLLAFLYPEYIGTRITAENSTFNNSFNSDFGSDKTKGTVGALSELGDFVWYDINGNGIQDDNEPGVSNVPVRLYKHTFAGDVYTLLQSTNTDSTGFYGFRLLPPSTVAFQYVVEFVPPSGYALTAQTVGSDFRVDSNPNTTTGRTADIPLSTSESNPTIDAGLVRLSSISGYVYHDSNNDGDRAGEAPISNVQVTLTGTDNVGRPVNLVQYTDQNGFYKFPDLWPGTYVLTETQPVDYLDGKDTVGTPGGSTTNDKFSNIILPGGFDGVENNFGEVLLVCAPPASVSCLDSTDPAVNPNLGYPSATGSSDCAPILFTFSDSILPAGDCAIMIVRTWTGTDNCGNTAVCQQEITVYQDSTPPSLTVPPDVEVTIGNVPPVGSASALDNCDVNPLVEYLGEVQNGSGCVYTLVRTWKATDACKNPTIKSQTITVKDKTAPDLTVPADVEVSCDAIPAPGTATATDNTDTNPLVEYLGEVKDGNGCTYKLIRTWKATDICGNSATKAQTITVKDTTAPELTVPADTEVSCDAIPTAGTATAKDNCDANPTVEYLGEVQNGSGCTYTIVRTWKAKDACDNSVTKTQTITVKDTTAPELTVPADTEVSCDAIPSAGTATAKDNCDANPTVEYLGEVQNGSGCTYTIVRTWKAKDACDNSATKSQTITVKDTTAPVLTVPADVEVSCDAIPAAGAATAKDNCDTNPTVTYQGEVKNGSGCTYTIVRTWKAKDACDNSATKSQTITVKDTTAPVLTVPADATASCDAVPAAGTATAKDNCDTAPVVTYMGEVKNGTDCSYTLVRTWKAKDACGNESTKSQTITVKDTTAPVITCPTGGGSTPSYDGLCSYTQGGWGATPNGNNPGSILANNFSAVYPGGYVQVGIPGSYGYSMKFTSAAAIQAYLPAGGTAGKLTGDLTNPTSSPAGVFGGQVLALQLNVDFSDAGKIGTVKLGDRVLNYPGSPFNGKTIRQILAIANTALGGGSVSGYGCSLGDLNSIVDSLNNAFDNCAASDWAKQHFATCSTGSGGSTGVATAKDNCDPNPVVTYTDSAATGDCCSGSIIRTWKATDRCGNSSTCTQTIAGATKDTTAPVLTVPANATVNCNAIPAAGTATAQDDCDTAPVVSYLGETKNGSGCTYTIVRTWKAVDQCGNAATCTQTITVLPGPPSAPTCLTDTPECGSVKLAWNASSGATSYSVKRATTKGGPYTTIKTGLTTTSYTDTTVTSGTLYYYVVSALKGSAESGNSNEASALPTCGVPSPWCKSDIGSCGERGGHHSSNGKFTLCGSGADIWDNADGFHYTYQSASANCTIIARCVSLSGNNGWAKAGVMIRESLSEGSKHASLFCTPSNGTAFQCRTSSGGYSENTNSGDSGPCWVKIVRNSNTFTCYRSSNGSTWTQVGTKNITMGSSVYIGLAVTSHDDGNLCTAVFDNVSVTP